MTSHRSFRTPSILPWSVKLAASLCCLIALAGSAKADTELSWDRSAEASVIGYRVYLCLTAGCTATKTQTPTASVKQTATGVSPRWGLLDGYQGAAVVTAIDANGNESGSSNMVVFVTLPPAAPTNLQIIP